MIDQTAINLLALIERDTRLKRVAGTNGGEYAGPCPFCGGSDRLRVWPNADRPSFWCRQCDRNGDAIAYEQQRGGVGFKEACDRLRLDTGQPPERRREPTRRPPLVSPENDWPALLNADWQIAAQDFVDECVSALQTFKGLAAKEYLWRRGILDSVIREHRVGYNAADRRVEWGGVKVWLPRGIVLPWLIDGLYWRINIRRLEKDADPKYMQPAGCANGLYRANQIYPGCTVVLVEGELDALSICSPIGAGNLVETRGVVPVATGSNTGAHLLRWVAAVAVAQRVLLAFDNDEAGEKAVEWWSKVLGSKAQRLKPLKHDVNAMLQARSYDLSQWIEESMEW